MFTVPAVTPSILTADFGNLREEVQSVEKAGCDLLHLDIMDGRFVENITFGMDIVKMLRSCVSCAFDIHLMILQPLRYVKEFAKAGECEKGGIITMHLEATPDMHRALQAVHALPGNWKAGVAFNPSTGSKDLEPFIDDIDEVTIMAVHPGKGGQHMIVETLPRIAQVREMFAKKNKDVLIEIDGGVKMDKLDLVKDADLVVMGSDIYTSPDPAVAAENYRKASERFKALKA